MENYAIEQLSVFIENQKGELASVTEILSHSHLSIHSITLSDSKDFGILRLIVSDAPKAKVVLEARGIPAKINKMLGVRVEDTVGSFHQIVRLLSNAGIDIFYTYLVIEGSRGIFLFRLHDGSFGQAVALLKEAGLEVVKRDFMES